MTEVRQSVACGVPDVARNLIWRTFFVEARRGVDFAAHLPWHRDSATRTIVLRGDDDDAALAVAVVRPARQAGVAMVGYVCVDRAGRGQGHGRKLMTAVNAVIEDIGCSAALLWTGKPEIYVGHGYDVVGRDDFLLVTRLAPAPATPASLREAAWPGNADVAGLPTFATSARRLRSDRAEAIVAEGPRGATLIDWSGAPVDVVAIVNAGGYAAWGVNVSAGNDFTQALTSDRYIVDNRPGAVAMARRAEPSFIISPVPVADRI